MTSSIDYRNKIILAPMVRIGTLPMRLLALHYGADLVYTEELIDYRLLKCQRIENKVLGTVDFVDDDHQIVFRTCEKEKGRNILQIGTCNPDRAVQIAKLVEKDVAGIDVNMGCPKEFSIKGGMGAALLTQTDKVKAILTALIQSTELPITCKIRVLEKLEDTLALGKLIESTGVKAIGVHGRTKEERPQHANRNAVIKALAEHVNIPIIANGGSGEIACYEDIERFRQTTGAASVMLARQAESNCSIFRKEGKKPIDDVIEEYLAYAIEYDNRATNTKYCVQQMLGSLQESDRGKALLASQQMEEICVLWNMQDKHASRQLKLQARAMALRELSNNSDAEPVLKKCKIGDDEVWQMEAKFVRNMFEMANLPKTVLINWTRKNNYPHPFYKTESMEKSFRSVVLVDRKKYSSTYLSSSGSSQPSSEKREEQEICRAECCTRGLICPWADRQLQNQG
ncbi:tRNA-dihydrouridine(20) synthase [NAD(P)+]-like isoform X1 [Rhipicephalus sanguineus]|uniref:tRNA-dihydrouridine(20) synthase [NAD(P)+]-like isoform X1 n=1 Tax=Rhipicephalus sanguineus TaxID=34632 RepID=UPI001894BAC1|nr:tRNA-dihydrouridine(20) synthase [NAD(P)+]-like isoform X1 [Rhipicephalus sanguineus]